MRTLREGFMLLLVLTLFTGVVYPLAVTGIAQVIFPERANGSLISEEGRIVGSRLIGQPFRDPGYLWPRRSATPVHPYNAAFSSGSNLGPLSPDLAALVEERVRVLRAQPDADSAALIPIDLVTSSGSGLDPHISPAAAFYQVERIARARGVAVERIRQIIEGHIEGRQLGILGEPRVNVLLVNLDLDGRCRDARLTPQRSDTLGQADPGTIRSRRGVRDEW